MRKLKISFLVLLLLGFVVSGASADIALFDWGFNVDGTIYTPGGPPLPGSFNTAGFDFATGLGTITAQLTGAGAHKFIGFFDHEIDEAINTFYNEYGAVSGAPAAGQSWEIDEPGFVFGDIYTNFTNGTLDNSNGVPAASPDDVSMAMGWNFILASGETATVRFNIGPGDLIPGFYLEQTDPDSANSIFLHSSLDIRGEGGEVPEPATMLLLGSGLAGLIGFGRKKLFKK